MLLAEDTMPAVAQRIRAVKGETVIVGIVSYSGTSYVDVVLDGADEVQTALIGIWCRDGWTVEVLS